jgi:uroporphyrinogen-III synthase
MGEGIILNTRPALYRERFHEAFSSIGWPIIDYPVLSEEALSPFVPPPQGFDAVIFTSPMAVRFFPVGEVWRSKLAFAVGPGTLDAARAAGFTNVVQTGSDADDLKRYLARAVFAKALYPSGEDVTSDFSEAFPGKIQRVVLYRMVAREALAGEIVVAIKNAKAVIAPVFSKRSAAVLGDLLNKAGLTSADITVVGISDEVLTGNGPWRARAVAAQPTLEAVAAAAKKIIAGVPAP